MFAKSVAAKRVGFLARLRKDERGNVIAIMAAAMFPAIGIIGGSVDMSRVYLTRTTLQSACDAGSLMGRRTMGTGTWAANSNKANTRAERMFDTNFAAGQYGSENLDRSFSESGGAVIGQASATLPMSLMSVFGIKDKTITVSCSSEMRIPASDIMFVLDTTGSMNCPDNGATCPGGDNGGVEASNAKIKGLRTAASCFYEALAKQNITAVTKAACNEAADPVGATSDVRLRFGFVPYSVNVNVGKLLPLQYMANQWTYQSREATWEPITDPNAYDASYGQEGSLIQTGSNTTNSSTGGWADISVNYTAPNNQLYSYYSESTNTLTCSTGIPSTTVPSTGNLTANGQSPTTVTYPTNAVTKYYYRNNGTVTYQYQYRLGSYQTGSGKKKQTWNYCQLQRRPTAQSSTRIDYQTQTTVNWVYAPQFIRWTYKPTTFNVSGLKDTANNSWNSAVNLPIGNSGTNRSVAWNGCIEERQTERVTDNDPSNNWNPIPDNALDMDIELEPVAGNLPTLWGPMMSGAIYTREIKSGSNSWSYTTNNFQTNSNEISSSVVEHSFGGQKYDPDQISESCPTQAKLYSEMGASAFWNYMASLQTGGNTYHDIGMLWGARLMAPEGIFKSITSDADTFVERHMIFMTDGDTSASSSNYAAYGVHWWDRRQNNGTSAPSDTFIEANIDARTQALCKWVRDENITLWVVAFGQGITAGTKTNLENCATSGRYFEATNTTTLITKFKEIASKISALRLTQ